MSKQRKKKRAPNTHKSASRRSGKNRSSKTQSSETDPEALPSRSEPFCVSTDNTIMPRYLAATCDLILAIIFACVTGVIVARTAGEHAVVLQCFSAGVVYVNYFFATEALFAATPAKLFFGLQVVCKNGSPISVRQAAIRTGIRFFEVELLGWIGALAIVFSKNRQRLGDRVAGTVVIRNS